MGCGSTARVTGCDDGDERRVIRPSKQPVAPERAIYLSEDRHLSSRAECVATRRESDRASGPTATGLSARYLAASGGTDGLVQAALMCGIAGLVAASAPSSRRAVAAMTARSRIAGPDGEGVFVDGACVVLGHRRLAIIDLAGGPPADGERRTDRSWSPSTARSTTTSSCARELEALGHALPIARPTPRCCSPRYAEWGADCLERLNGMFAFAIWDREREHALLRPRPLRHQAALLHARPAGASASRRELKALLLRPGRAARANDARVLDFLARGSPTTRTRRSSRGSAGAAGPPDLRGGAVRPRREPGAGTASGRRRAKRAGPAQDPRLLDDAVSLRLRSDVPVGDSASPAAWTPRRSSCLGGRIARRTARGAETFSAALERSAHSTSAPTRSESSRRPARTNEVRPTSTGCSTTWTRSVAHGRAVPQPERLRAEEGRRARAERGRRGPARRPRR